MASRSPLSGEPAAASAGASDALEVEKKLTGAGDKALSVEDDDEEDEDGELELDEDDDDEELVVYTAKEAAGALATIYAFIKPFLKNYKKILALVSIGVLV